MLTVLLLGCTEPVTSPPPHCSVSTTVDVRTDDGATIALHHHAAPGPPVLLVHGIASNHRFWDLDREHSFALWLQERGWDVWLLDLRGHGNALYDGDGRRQYSGWTVDDYGRHDAAAAVDYVRACTAYDQVAWVGHSMGGMVGAIYAVSGGEPSLASLVAVGSPAAFSLEDPLVKVAQGALASGGTVLWWVETPVFAAAAADLGGAVPGRLHERLYNPANFEPDTIDRMLRSITAPLSREEMRHFARMLDAERFQSADGTVDYRAAMGGLTVPTFAIGGAADRIVPAERVRAYAEAVGGPHEYWLAGRDSGTRHDYGHLDLGLGEHAETEIFPRIEAWIARTPPRRDPE